MAFNLYKRNFLTLLDFSKDEIYHLLFLARDLKNEKRKRFYNPVLKGRNIVILFQKDSTRTRCSFEVAAFDLGMNVTYVGGTGSQMGKKESIKDTARVLGRMYDGIEFRGFKHEDVIELGKYAGVPVWNGLTDDFHPTQILADFFTIMEKKNTFSLKGLKLVYFGDARNNMANSLMIGAAKLGMIFVACAPKELWPRDNKYFKLETLKKLAKENGGEIIFVEAKDKTIALKNADAIYTDVWVSMGEEALLTQRISDLKEYQVTMDVIKMTSNPDVIFMHCLPAFHNNETITAQKAMELSEDVKKWNGAMEVTEEVFESKYSVVFDQAENRLHTIKAVILATLI